MDGVLCNFEKGAVDTAGHSQKRSQDQECRNRAIVETGPLKVKHLHRLCERLLTDLAKDQTQHNSGNGISRATQEETRYTGNEHHDHIDDESSHRISAYCREQQNERRQKLKRNP